MWIKDLTGGRSLGQHGGLFSPALDVAAVLLEFIAAGKVTAHPDHCDITDIEATVTGETLIELFRATESQTGKRLVERDGSSSVDCVDAGHRYGICYIEF